MAYVVSAAFLAITGFFFVASVSDAFAEASIRGYLAGAIFFMNFHVTSSHDASPC